MNISRRRFLNQTAVGLVSGAALEVTSFAQAPSESQGGEKPLIVSTWPFGKPANDAALAVLRRGGSILDAVEQGIWVPESDPANHSVGLEGKPNPPGVVPLDACIISRPRRRRGTDHEGGDTGATR